MRGLRLTKGPPKSTPAPGESPLGCTAGSEEAPVPRGMSVDDLGFALSPSEELHRFGCCFFLNSFFLNYLELPGFRRAWPPL